MFFRAEGLQVQTKGEIYQTLVDIFPLLERVSTGKYMLATPAQNHLIY
jgi:hypothetical protein